MIDARLLEFWALGWGATAAIVPAALRAAWRAWSDMSDFQRVALALGGLCVWYLARITRLLGSRDRTRLNG